MVDFGDEFHLDGLEWIGFGDHDVLRCLMWNVDGRMGSRRRLNKVNHLHGGDRTALQMLPNETHNIKASTFIRRAFGPLKCALEMKR